MSYQITSKYRATIKFMNEFVNTFCVSLEATLLARSSMLYLYYGQQLSDAKQ